MLKRVHRLPPFIRLTHAKSLRFPYVTIKYQATDNAVSRASIVISKKVSPLATKRNRLKRLVAAQLTKLLTAASSSHDLLLILHPNSAKLPEEEFVIRLAEDLKKLPF